MSRKPIRKMQLHEKHGECTAGDKVEQFNVCETMIMNDLPFHPISFVKCACVR